MRSTFFTSLNKALSTEICHKLSHELMKLIEKHNACCILFEKHNACCICLKITTLVAFCLKSQHLLYLFENHNACYIFLVFIFPCRYQRSVMSSNGKLKFSGASVVKAGSWETGQRCIGGRWLSGCGN